MSHWDDKWLVVPPAIAPLHIVIIPIAKDEETLQNIKEYLTPLTNILDKEKLSFNSKYFDQKIDISYKIDDDQNYWVGRKYTQYELQWVPLRISVWKKEMENQEVEIYTRQNQEKKLVKMSELLTYVDKALYKIQNNILQQNFLRTIENTKIAENYEDFKKKLTDKDWKNSFVFAHWDGINESAEKIQEETKATIRCIPFDLMRNIANFSETVKWHIDFANIEKINQQINQPWKCIISWKPSQKMVLFAKAY